MKKGRAYASSQTQKRAESWESFIDEDRELKEYVDKLPIDPFLLSFYVKDQGDDPCL